MSLPVAKNVRSDRTISTESELQAEVYAVRNRPSILARPDRGIKQTPQEAVRDTYQRFPKTMEALRQSELREPAQ